MPSVHWYLSTYVGCVKIRMFFLCTVNISDIEYKASKVDVSSFKICDLCERNGENQIEVKFFQLPQRLRDILLPLDKVHESSTFQQLWEQYGKKAQRARENDESQKRELSVLNVVDNVWKPAYEGWSRLVRNVLDGSLTLTGVDRFFKDYKNKRKDLVKELCRIFTLGRDSTDTSQVRELAEKRVAEIYRYQQLDQYSIAAETVLDFKESMGFTGDFKVIEDVRNQVSFLTWDTRIIINCVQLAAYLVLCCKNFARDFLRPDFPEPVRLNYRKSAANV